MQLINRQQAEDLLRSSKKILIAPSSPMDGDSVGPTIARIAKTDNHPADANQIGAWVHADLLHAA